MKILNEKNNVCDFLAGLHGKEVVIVSAFASSGTIACVRSLLDRKNKIELLIGTINAFTSPDFMGYCREVSPNKLSLAVDFRDFESIHWKLYLVKPETVIVGSANFTLTGLTLKRDTCVLIKDSDLFDRYMEEIAEVKKANLIIDSKHERFQEKFDIYSDKHKRAQAGRVRDTAQASLLRGGSSSTIKDWLGDEANEQLPIFVWGHDHDYATKAKADEILNDTTKAEADNEDASEVLSTNLRDFFTTNGDKSEFPYKQGDVVLCMNSNGAYIDFYTFDRVLHKDGVNYAFSYKRERYSSPFNLAKKIKALIKRRIKNWPEQGQKYTYIKRSEIQKWSVE